MNKLISVAITAIIATIGIAEESLKFSEMTPEQRKEVRRINLLKRTGGYLDRREKDSGKFLVVNAQKRVGDVYAEQLKIITSVFEVEMIPAETTDAVRIESAKEILKKMDGAMGIFIIDVPEYPTLIVCPENGYGFVNVGALAADNPGKALLEKRVTSERLLWLLDQLILNGSHAYLAQLPRLGILIA